MFNKIHRLSRDRDFKKVFKYSKPVYFGNLILRYAKSSRESGIGNRESRFGFVISNKIDKRATKRNELKRKLRAIIFSFLPKIQPGFDIILLVSKNYSYPYDYLQIKIEVENVFKKAGLLYD